MVAAAAEMLSPVAVVPDAKSDVLQVAATCAPLCVLSKEYIHGNTAVIAGNAMFCVVPHREVSLAARQASRGGRPSAWARTRHATMYSLQSLCTYSSAASIAICGGTCFNIPNNNQQNITCWAADCNQPHSMALCRSTRSRRPCNVSVGSSNCN